MIDLIEIARGWAEDPALLKANADLLVLLSMLSTMAGALCFFAALAFIETKLTTRIAAALYILFTISLIVFTAGFGWTVNYASALSGLS